MAKQFDVKALREKVMSTDDIKYDSVYVKAWDAELPVKSLSSAEMKEVTKYREDPVRMMIVAVLNGCKTEDGEAVFQPTDLAKFEKEKAFAPIETVAEKILEMSGFDDESVADAKNN